MSNKTSLREDLAKRFPDIAMGHIDAILYSVLEALPEEKKLSSDTWLKVKEKEGFNQCLTEVKQTLQAGGSDE